MAVQYYDVHGRPVNHTGYAIVELGTEHLYGYLVPVNSAYMRPDQARRVAFDAVRAATGECPAELYLWPASQSEAARKAMERELIDRPGGMQEWEEVYVEPRAALKATEAVRAEAAAHSARAALALNRGKRPGYDADGMLDLVRGMGYTAEYSRGLNVWANSPDGPDDKALPEIGFRWAEKRGQWYYRVEEHMFAECKGKNEVSHHALAACA